MTRFVRSQDPLPPMPRWLWCCIVGVGLIMAGLHLHMGWSTEWLPIMVIGVLVGWIALWVGIFLVACVGIVLCAVVDLAHAWVVEYSEAKTADPESRVGAVLTWLRWVRRTED